MSWICNPPSTNLKLRTQSIQASQDKAKPQPKNQEDVISKELWQKFQSVLLEALLPYDDARAAAADALLRLNRELEESS